MNIILFHFGVYDDRQEDYHIRFPLYSKCYDSIKREFNKDNILVFYSYEEVYDKFPQMREDLQKYEEFLSYKNQDLYRLDLVRCLLSKYCENMLYIDSDIYVEKGFKKNLVLNINRNIDKYLFYECNTMAIFYSRKPSSAINDLLMRFTKDYTYDVEEIIKSGINSHSERGNFDLYKLKYSHFGGLSFLRNSKIDRLEKDNEEDEKLYIDDDGTLVFKSKYFDAKYYCYDGITINDLLVTVGKEKIEMS